MSKLIGARSARVGAASFPPAAWLGADFTDPGSRRTYS